MTLIAHMFDTIVEKALAVVRKVPFLSESNRDKHFLYAIPCGLFLTILFVLGLAVGMEYKDKLKGGKFDWLDLGATILGGLIGHGLRVLFLSLI